MFLHFLSFFVTEHRKIQCLSEFRHVIFIEQFFAKACKLRCLSDIIFAKARKIRCITRIVTVLGPKGTKIGPKKALFSFTGSWEGPWKQF